MEVLFLMRLLKNFVEEFIENLHILRLFSENYKINI